jgi:histone H3/H4
MARTKITPKKNKNLRNAIKLTKSKFKGKRNKIQKDIKNYKKRTTPVLQYSATMRLINSLLDEYSLSDEQYRVSKDAKDIFLNVANDFLKDVLISANTIALNCNKKSVGENELDALVFNDKQRRWGNILLSKSEMGELKNNFDKLSQIRQTNLANKKKKKININKQNSNINEDEDYNMGHVFDEAMKKKQTSTVK